MDRARQLPAEQRKAAEYLGGGSRDTDTDMNTNTGIVQLTLTRSLAMSLNPQVLDGPGPTTKPTEVWCRADAIHTNTRAQASRAHRTCP